MSAILPIPSSPEEVPRLPPSVGGRRTLGAAFRHRNYRLWFGGQLFSLLGTWMQSTAQGYLVYELTRSSAYLGYTAFAAGAPTWALMLYGGVVADRLPLRRLLLYTQAGMMVLAAALALLTFGGWVRPWHILALAAGLGVANAFDAPARQAFVLELVGREDLTNAIALNSTLFNAAVATGPAVAGLLYAGIGPGWCFLINALSFLPVMGALAAMRLGPARSLHGGSAWGEMREGVRYVVAQPVIRVLVLLIASVSLFGICFIPLIPAWAVRLLHGDAATAGWLQSARGVGALAAALLVAAWSYRRLKGRLLTAGTLGLPLFLFAFAAARTLPLSLLTLAGAGFCLILVFNLTNALVQEQVDDRLRGRVMGAYSLTFFGLFPFGSLGAGLLAEHLGEPAAVTIGASATLLCALALYRAQPRIRALP